MADPLTIDCDDCVMQGTEACDDCLVTFLCGRPDGAPLVVAAEEVHAVRLLASSGLVPHIRHVRRCAAPRP